MYTYVKGGTPHPPSLSLFLFAEQGLTLVVACFLVRRESSTEPECVCARAYPSPPAPLLHSWGSCSGVGEVRARVCVCVCVCVGGVGADVLWVVIFVVVNQARHNSRRVPRAMNKIKK